MHRQRWENTLISSVTTVENQVWSLLGPFKKNRERIEFYNKNTEILVQMAKQIESDNKMGKEFMEKQVRNAKKENILKSGLDSAGLTEYTNAMSTIDSLGVKKILSEKEKKDFLAAKKIKDDAEVPDEAVGVDIYYNDPEGKFQRKRFLTEAVDLDTSSSSSELNKSRLGEKIMISRTGEKKTIEQLRQERNKSSSSLN